MDGERFDRLARALASSTSRRSAVKAFAATIGTAALTAITLRRPTMGSAFQGSSGLTVTAASGRTLGQLTAAADKSHEIQPLRIALQKQGYAPSAGPTAVIITQNGSQRQLLLRAYTQQASGDVAMLGYDGSAAALVQRGGALAEVWTVNNGVVQTTSLGAVRSGDKAFAAPLSGVDCDTCTGYCGVVVDIAEAVTDTRGYGAGVSICLVAVMTVCASQTVATLGRSDSALCSLQVYQDCQALETISDPVSFAGAVGCYEGCTQLGSCSQPTPTFTPTPTPTATSGGLDAPCTKQTDCDASAGQICGGNSLGSLGNPNHCYVPGEFIIDFVVARSGLVGQFDYFLEVRPAGDTSGVGEFTVGGGYGGVPPDPLGVPGVVPGDYTATLSSSLEPHPQFGQKTFTVAAGETTKIVWNVPGLCPDGWGACADPTTHHLTCIETTITGSDCGVCGTVCDPTGFCVDTTADAANCGACYNICASGQTCVDSVCVGTPNAATPVT